MRTGYSTDCERFHRRDFIKLGTAGFLGLSLADLLRLEVPALIVPGHDASHATSAARYLEECLPGSQYWDVAVDDQRADNFAQSLKTFLSSTVL